ncbi:hypothetical protein GOV13_02380 [Candidatus Pacearchaeota archaeon]|nr:hypothetical protein [Candidatus Pacearchaeota archaeon]
MPNKTKQAILSHINKIISEFKFSNRKLKHPKECPCYLENKPCHNVGGELNCFLCYCPEYDNSKEEGGCKINSKKGKWHVHENGKIWDCSDCDHPHKEETVRKHLKELFGID